MTNVGREYATPNVIAEEFQEGLIILNMETGMYFDVGERLVPLLGLLTKGTGLLSLQLALDGAEAGAGTEAVRVITLMDEQGLLRPCICTNKAVSPEQASLVLEAGAQFHFASHDDLAELIAADPVHDVDPETGHLRT